MSGSSALPMHASQDDPQTGFFNQHRSTQSVDKQRKIALFFSYARDWALTLALGGLSFLLNKVDPFKRDFSLDDISIQYPFAVHERVSDTMLFLCAFVAPLIIMAGVNLISIRSCWDFHTSWLGAISALAITGTVTNIVKVTTGRPRPDCIERCQPRLESVQPVFGLTNATVCTQTDNSILWDGFRSFPSGHSSLAFAGLGFLSLYLAGKLHLHDRQGHTIKAWICAMPLMGAALIAISRTMDYRHHWHDVLVGGLLGLLLAWFSYRQYYPSLWSPLCHRPYSPRIRRVRAALSGLIRDVEHIGETGEYEGLNAARDLHHTDQVDELELHGNLHGEQTPHVKDAPPSLAEVWKQGEGAEILPPGQVHSSLPGPGDHQV